MDITTASFDELAALWTRHWPKTLFNLFLRDPRHVPDGEVEWECGIEVSREHFGGRPFFPPVGRAATPTDALRAMLAALIDGDEDIAQVLAATI